MPAQSSAQSVQPADLEGASRSVRLDNVLTTLLAQTPEVEGAAVVSFDGLPMASALPESMDEDRVAAMSAALLSLGERAAEGLGRGELSQVYIEGDNGTVFLISCDDEAVLVAVAAKGAKVGMMLYEVRRSAAIVGRVLQAQDEPVQPDQPVDPASAPSASAPSASVSPASASPASALLAPVQPAPALLAPVQPAPEQPAAVTAPVSPVEAAPVPAYLPPFVSTPPTVPTVTAVAVPAQATRETVSALDVPASAWTSDDSVGSVLPGEPPRWS